MSYYSTITGDSPFAYYRLDDTSGITCTDNQATYNATYQNSPTLNVSGALLPSNDANAAIRLNGSNQYATLPAMGVYASFTIECWVFMGMAVTSNNGVFGTANAASARACRLLIRPTGVFFGVAPANGTESGNQPSSATNEGIWTYWAGVYDGTAHTSTIYRNGVQLAQLTGLAAGSLDMGATTNNCIGADRSGGTPFIGVLDEVAMYSTALSATQVSTHYLAGNRLANSLNNYRFVSVGDGMGCGEKIR